MPEVRHFPSGDPSEVLLQQVARLTADLADLRGTVLARTSLNEAYLRAADVTATTLLTDETTTSAAYTDLVTVGPSVTVTIGPSGLALVILSANTYSTAAGVTRSMSCALSGATTRAASDIDVALVHYSDAANSQLTGSVVRELSGLTPGGTTFTSKYACLGAGHFRYRQIAVVPL